MTWLIYKYQVLEFESLVPFYKRAKYKFNPHLVLSMIYTNILRDTHEISKSIFSFFKITLFPQHYLSQEFPYLFSILEIYAQEKLQVRLSVIGNCMLFLISQGETDMVGI